MQLREEQVGVSFSHDRNLAVILAPPVQTHVIGKQFVEPDGSDGGLKSSP